MFCTNCGKEIIETAKFCNFCGTPIRNMAASIPVQPTQSQPVYQQPVQNAPVYSESASITVREDISANVSEEIAETPDIAESTAETEKTETADMAPPIENTAENTEETTADNAVPTPNTIPTYGASESVYPAPPAYPAPAQTTNTIPVQSAELNPINKPERKYTLGHIMMCLAAVAIMAIVAGVFAGLYFSVV